MSTEKTRHSGKRFVLGISGGHHMSEAVALDLETRTIVRASGEPFNVHRLEDEQVSSRIEVLLNTLAVAMKCGLSDATALKEASENWMFSLPGAWRDPDKAKALRVIRKSGWRAPTDHVIDDALAGLFVETATFHGVCAFAGTGASVVRADGMENIVKVDGWGPVIGDFGSSFGIVANYFRHLRRVLDAGGICPYFESIRLRCRDLPSVEHVQDWFDELLVGGGPEWPVQFAFLAKELAVAADKEHSDDLPASRMILSAADELVESIKIALSKSTWSETIPLVFQGGLLRHCHKYRTRVISALAGFRVNPIIARDTPVCGALLLALRERPAILTEIHQKLKL